MDRRDYCPGYTLLELLMVLLIIGTILGLGSGFGDLVDRERQFRNVLDLRRLLNYARAEAVNLQKPVTLCALDKQHKCDRDWRGRDVAVFLDVNRNRRLDQGEVLRLEHWPENRGWLSWRASLRSRHITFRPGGDTAQNGSFLLCRESKTGEVDTAVVINRGGRNYVREADGRPCP